MNGGEVSDRSGSRLVSIMRFTQRQPKARIASIGILALILTAAVELWLADTLPPFPVYYLLPVLLLAWFLGRAPAILSTALSAIGSTGIILLSTPSAMPSLLTILARAATFVGVGMGAGVANTARLMLEYYYRGGAWRALQKPMRVGQRLVIIPSLPDKPTESQADLAAIEVAVHIEPGLAFGTSSHPTTQMCLELLERYLQPGDAVFDLGCGTGILAIAAARLGADEVLAVDIDPEAERVTRANIRRNELSDRVEFRRGSLKAVTADHHAQGGGRKFDLGLANLFTHLLVEVLQGGLAETVKAGGVLILSGIRAGELAAIQSSIQSASLEILEQLELGDWVALAARSLDAGRNRSENAR